MPPIMSVPCEIILITFTFLEKVRILILRVEGSGSSAILLSSCYKKIVSKNIFEKSALLRCKHVSFDSKLIAYGSISMKNNFVEI